MESGGGGEVGEWGGGESGSGGEVGEKWGSGGTVRGMTNSGFQQGTH